MRRIVCDWMIGLLGGALLVACGNDGDAAGGAAGQSNQAGDMAQMVSADSGGDLSMGGVIDINIPPGALASDTEVSVHIVDTEQSPEPELLLSQGIELGPDGLTFEMPVALVVRFNTAGVPDMTKVKLAWFDEAAGSWLPLADSSVDVGAGTVTASTEHFSFFGAVYDD